MHLPAAVLPAPEDISAASAVATVAANIEGRVLGVAVVGLAVDG